MHLLINSEEDARDALFRIKRELELKAVQTAVSAEFITLASELLFNVLRHGKAGFADFYLHKKQAELIVKDQGAGFLRLGERAFADGVSTAQGLGLGLGAAVRMADTFSLQTGHQGTSVKVTKQVQDD